MLLHREVCIPLEEEQVLADVVSGCHLGVDGAELEGDVLVHVAGVAVVVDGRTRLGGQSASSTDSIGGSFSYSTTMRSQASAAVSSSMAATAATGSPTKRTRSGQSACSSCEMGRMPNGMGRSRPVSTATTPGYFSAREYRCG